MLLYLSVMQRYYNGNRRSLNDIKKDWEQLHKSTSISIN